MRHHDQHPCFPVSDDRAASSFSYSRKVGLRTMVIRHQCQSTPRRHGRISDGHAGCDQPGHSPFGTGHISGPVGARLLDRPRQPARLGQWLTMVKGELVPTEY
jgi:hypothetical protein